MTHSKWTFLCVAAIAALVGCGGGGGGGEPAGAAGDGVGIEPTGFALTIDGSTNLYSQTVLADGSFLVTGDYGRTLTLGSSDGANRTEAVTDPGTFLARYNAAGELQWVRTIPGSGEFRVRNAFALADGSVLAYCSCSGVSTFDGFALGGGGPLTFFFLGLDPADGSTLSVRTVWSGDKGHIGQAAAAPDGTVYAVLTHYTSSSTLDPDSASPVALKARADNGWSVVVVKYAPDGSRLWYRLCESSDGFFFADSATVFADGSLVLGMTFYVDALFSSNAADAFLLQSNTGDYNGALVRYGPDGALSWVKDLDGRVQAKQILEVDDGLAVAGQLLNPARFGVGEPNETLVDPAGGYDGYFARYESNGTLRWVRPVSGPKTDSAYGLARTGDGGFVVTGWLTATAVFGPGAADELSVDGSDPCDPFVARYDIDGRVDWVRTFPCPDYANGLMVAVRDNGRILAIGSYSGELSFPGATTPDLVAVSGSALYVAQLESDGTLLR